MFDSIDDYKKALAVYEGLCTRHSDLMDELKTLIYEYAEDRDEIKSNDAGASTLRQWPRLNEFKTHCRGWDRQVFGIALRERLKAIGWAKDDGESEGRKVTTYWRD